MLTNKITGFSADFLDAVKNILGEAKKCGDCGCGQCECEKKETKEGYMPTSDEPTDANKKTADKVRALLAKEKKPVKEESGMPFEKPYRKAGERKDEYGNKVKNVAKHLAKKAMKANEEVLDELSMNTLDSYRSKARKEIIDADANDDNRMYNKRTKGYTKASQSIQKNFVKGKGMDEAIVEVEQIDEISAKTAVSAYAKRNAKAFNDGQYDDEAEKDYNKLDKQGDRIQKKFGNKIVQKAQKAASKKIFGEEVEELDEISSDMAHRYLKGKRERDYDISADGKSSKLKKPQSFGKMNKDMKSTMRALRTIEKAKKTNEEAEQIDELKDKTLGSYINKAKDSIDTASYRQGHKEAHGSSSKALERKLSKRHKGIETAVKKLTREDAEQIDELKDKTLGDYIKKAATKIGTQGVTAGLKIAKDERSQKNFDTIGKRERGIALAVKKLTKEEQDFIDALNDADMDQIDEANYDVDHMPGQTMSASAADKQTKKVHDDWAAGAAARAKGRAEAAKRKLAKEEVEINEARGRPRKAGAKDFTIHPKTKEKLMHDNPAHMKRIEALQKTGALKKPKTEANQHIIQQLQRAKLSMRGGETVNFTHGDSKQVTGAHAAKLLDKYAGMKPDEKEVFQKDIGHSHARLMKHV